MKQQVVWCIADYFKTCDELLQRNETAVFVSPPCKNMAKIDVSEVTFHNVRYPMVRISIKTHKYRNLISVRCCHNQECIIEQKFNGLSTGWKTLVVQKQFPDLKTRRLALSFEFVFKNDGNENELLKSFLMNPEFSDITIKTSKGDEIPAHKILLVASSYVFRAQFQHNTAENNTVECAFETNVVKDLLSYIYQDVAPNIGETAFKLIVAADYYELDRLKELCGDVLRNKLNVDNAIRILILADHYDMYSLKISALEFIKILKNYVEVVKTDEWRQLSKELYESVFEFILKD